MAKRLRHGHLQHRPSRAHEVPTAALALLPAVLLAGALGAQEVVDLPEADRFPVLDLDEVYRVGGSDLLLSRVRKAEFGGDGTLYLLDGNSASSARLLAIRDDGRTAVQLGEPGDGPGEFGGLPHFAPLGDRHVAAFDLGQNAYLVFSSDGELVRTVGAGGGGRVAGFGNMARVVRPDRARNGLFMVNPLNRTAVSRGSAGESGRAAILRVGLGGDDISTRTVLQAWSPVPVTRGLGDFEPNLNFDAFPDGTIVYSDSSAYSIKVTDPGGDLVRVMRRPIFPTAVTARHREAGAEAIRRTLEEADLSPAYVDQWMENVAGDALDESSYYHEVPVVEGVKAGWDRSVWVQRRNPAHLLSANIVDDYVPGPVDLLLATGDYVGTFDPSDLPMPMALGPDGLAAFLELDALDVPTVVVRRLPTELR